MENSEQPFFPALEDFDYERPQQNDGSVRASNFMYPETLSPDVSRPSRSNSSSPIAVLDSFNISRNEYRHGSPFERHSIVQYPRASSINNGHAVVDLTSDDSDGDEEESELREIDMGSRGKRKLPSWAGAGASERKRPRESMGHFQSGSQLYAGNNPFSHFAKKPAEMPPLSNRSRSWEPSSRYPPQFGNLESSITTATSLRGIPGTEAQRGTSMYRETYASSVLSMAKRTSSGEVSTSYERGALRVLPGTMSTFTGLANGMRLAGAADQRLSIVVDPVKRSEELAHQAVFQVLIYGLRVICAFWNRNWQVTRWSLPRQLTLIQLCCTLCVLHCTGKSHVLVELVNKLLAGLKLSATEILRCSFDCFGLKNSNDMIRVSSLPEGFPWLIYGMDISSIPASLTPLFWAGFCIGRRARRVNS